MFLCAIFKLGCLCLLYPKELHCGNLHLVVYIDQNVLYSILIVKKDKSLEVGLQFHDMTTL